MYFFFNSSKKKEWNRLELNQMLTGIFAAIWLSSSETIASGVADISRNGSCEMFSHD